MQKSRHDARREGTWNERLDGDGHSTRYAACRHANSIPRRSIRLRGSCGACSATESVVIRSSMKKAALFVLAVLPCIASGSHLRTTPKFEAELATKVGVHMIENAEQKKTTVLSSLEAIHALRSLLPSVNLNLEGQAVAKLLKNIASGSHTVLDPSESDYLGKYIIRHYGTMSSKLALQRHSNRLDIVSHLDAAERPLITDYGTIKPTNVAAPLVVDFTANDHVFDGLRQFQSATGVEESATGATGGSATGATGGSATGATGNPTGSTGQEGTIGSISAATLVANTRLDRLKKNTTVASTEEEDDAADAQEDARQKAQEEASKNQTKSTQGTLVNIPTHPVNKLKDKIREIEEKLLGLKKATETKVTPKKTAGTAGLLKPDKPVVTAEDVVNQLRHKDKKGASQLLTRHHNMGVSVNHTLEPTRDDGRVNQFEWIKDGRMGSSVFRQYKQLKQMRRNAI